MLYAVSTVGMLGMLQWNDNDDVHVIASPSEPILGGRELSESGFFSPG